ncbi:MAG: hypothetical protein V1911_00430 [Candidatus Micrarchaeota archaeon]
MDFIEITSDQKKGLLSLLGYDIDKENFLKYRETGEQHICPISHKKVKLENASIVPGSTLVINSDLLTISEYLVDYLEK